MVSMVNGCYYAAWGGESRPQVGSVLGSSYAFSEPHSSELQKWSWLGGLQESLLRALATHILEVGEQWVRVGEWEGLVF